MFFSFAGIHHTCHKFDEIHLVADADNARHFKSTDGPRGLFICEFTLGKMMVQNDNFPVKKWTFYLRIQDSRSLNVRLLLSTATKEFHLQKNIMRKRIPYFKQLTQG